MLKMTIAYVHLLATCMAPATIARLYPGPQGYGYVKGGLAGLISVRVPYAYDRSVVFDNP